MATPARTRTPRRRAVVSPPAARDEVVASPTTDEAALWARPELLITFATAPTGLGHLRVTHALRGGLPKEAGAVLLGADDHVLDLLHRVASLDPTAKRIFEWMQRGRPEDVATAISRAVLRTTAPLLRGELHRLVTQRLDRPRLVLAVATHFSLAHQLCALKAQLFEEKHVKLLVAVQVTDDSPQHIWLVPGADLIVVPSEHTRQGLTRYGQEHGLTVPPIVVAPYPVSPTMAEPLSEKALAWRAAQLDPESEERIHVSLPVSGAAVGLGFSLRLMDRLHRLEPRFFFSVVSRHNPYTFPFLTRVISRGYAQVQASGDDRDVVAAYERAFQQSVMSLEVTKPSEQCFKALLSPALRGGVILLLSAPVGRQEYDNLDFLRRNGLLPSHREQELLWRAAREGRALSAPERRLLDPVLTGWRGLQLPRNAAAAARFIRWCHAQRLFARMRAWRAPAHAKPAEVSPDGVPAFWSALAGVVREHVDA